jgi:hypothetical protein
LLVVVVEVVALLETLLAVVAVVVAYLRVLRVLLLALLLLLLWVVVELAVEHQPQIKQTEVIQYSVLSLLLAVVMAFPVLALQVAALVAA